MGATIKEVLMDWLDINEFHNVRIDSKRKAYVDTLTPDEEFYLMAKTNADDGDAVEIHLNLIDKNKTLLKTIELEGHVENEEVKMTLKVKDLSNEHNLDLNAIKEINATLHYEKEKYPTNKVRIFRTLKSKELSDSGELNDIVEGKVAKAYKKSKGTVPNSKGDEVKLIQEALQKMKINIGNDGVDGVFGKDGHNAVMTFQESYKPTHNVHQYAWAEPDGIVGKNTLLAMDEALVGGWKYEIKGELITKEMINAVCPGKGNDSELIKYLNEFSKKYEVNTKYRIAHFISQIAHESSFLVSTESLNYSKNRMQQIFGCKDHKINWDKTHNTCLEIHRKRLKLWTNPTNYTHDSKNLANYVYGDRIGNGNEASGDGYKYRGRGLIQLTGKDNYKTFTKLHNTKSPDDLQNFENNPDLIVTNKKYGVESAFVYWNMVKINNVANGKETKDIKKVTIKINGGTNGLEDRLTKFKAVIKLMEKS